MHVSRSEPLPHSHIYIDRDRVKNTPECISCRQLQTEGFIENRNVKKEKYSTECEMHAKYYNIRGGFKTHVGIDFELDSGGCLYAMQSHSTDVFYFNT